MAKPFTTVITSSRSGYHTAGSSDRIDFRVRVPYIFRVERSLLVGLGMELLKGRAVCSSNLFVLFIRKNG